MKNKRDLILEASLEVFIEKGYNLSTTLEISKKALVSEMTLFRHFKTKNNLFLESIKQAIGDSIISDLSIDINLDFKDFTYLLMHKKLLMISKHIKLVKMLIRERLAHTLPQELDFTRMMYTQMIQNISKYVLYHQLSVNPNLYAEIMVGLMLRYAIMEEQPVYHLLKEDDQQKYLVTYLNILNI
ncbi:MAG: TetR/AcrR family transcriptional regulator [Acholeplasmataceae bacterium]|nr:TetR/AcrR family transcriptional regulator [Acholeplasmataceae bacterium]